MIPSFVDVVRLLAAGGGIGAVLSFLLERVPWFQRLGSQARYWLILGVCIGLPVVATILLQFVPESAWKAMEPIWNAVAAGFVVWISSQAFHGSEKRATAREQRMQ